MGGPRIAIHKEIFSFHVQFQFSLTSNNIKVEVTACKNWMKCHMRYEIQVNMIFTDSSSSSSSSSSS